MCSADARQPVRRSDQPRSNTGAWPICRAVPLTLRRSAIILVLQRPSPHPPLTFPACFASFCPRFPAQLIGHLRSDEVRRGQNGHALQGPRSRSRRPHCVRAERRARDGDLHDGCWVLRGGDLHTRAPDGPRADKHLPRHCTAETHHHRVGLSLDCGHPLVAFPVHDRDTSCCCLPSHTTAHHDREQVRVFGGGLLVFT